MPASIFIGVLTYFFFKWIHRYQVFLYVGATVFAILGFILELEPLIVGELASGFWLVVMLIGALDPKAKLGQRGRMVRKELAIIGFILISSHALFYLVKPDWEWFGIIAFALMVPLTIMSFTIIRKQMTPRLWKQLQTISYVIYGLTYIHFVVVGALEYTLFYAIYLGLKIRYEHTKRSLIASKKPLKHTSKKEN